MSSPPKSCGETWTRGVFTFTGVRLVRPLYRVFLFVSVECSGWYCGGCSYWSVTPSSLLDVYRPVSRTCRCHLQDGTACCLPAADSPFLRKVATFVQEGTASLLVMSVAAFTVHIARKWLVCVLVNRLVCRTFDMICYVMIYDMVW